ncbi:response regulator [Agrobacterium sp. ES01]|uniref:response regulator n=1 Tax=Agrobacterium sp. ES01 TaxID=3420714 RepID=UPI003D0C893C
MTNILMIDDSESDLALFSELIEQADPNYSVYTARNAKEGLDLFQEHHIDCALIDFYMPEVNGLRVLDRLQEMALGRVLPLIIFTGSGGQKIQAEAARRGAMDYIVKDPGSNTSEQLDAAIRKVIAWAEALNNNKVRVN